MLINLPAVITIVTYFAGDPEPMLVSQMLDGRTAFSRIGAEQCLDKTGGPQVCLTEAGALIVDDVELPPLAPATPRLPGPALGATPQPPAPHVRPPFPAPPLCCDRPDRPVIVPPEPPVPSPVPLPASLPMLFAALLAVAYFFRRVK